MVKIKKILSKNASLILSITSTVGFIGTVYTAVKATPKALDIINDIKEEMEDEEPKVLKMEIVKQTWRLYLPSVVIGASTIACIFGIHIFNKKTQATLASAYGMLYNSYTQYRQKIIETYGYDEDKRINYEILKDQLEDENLECSQNTELFYDPITKNMFESTEIDVMKAVLELNTVLLIGSAPTLNVFYETLGLPVVHGIHDRIGWNPDYLFDSYYAPTIKLKDFDIATIQTDTDEFECKLIDFNIYPEYLSDEAVEFFDVINCYEYMKFRETY